MRRIKLSRPPPASSETAETNLPDIKADRLKNVAAVTQDTRKVVEHDRAVVERPCASSITSAPEDASPDASRMQEIVCHHTELSQVLCHPNDDIQSYDAEHHVSVADDTNPVSQDSISFTQKRGRSKKHSKSAVRKSSHDNAEIAASEFDDGLLLKQSDSKCISDMADAFVEMPEHCHSAKLRVSLDEALKGFLVQKLAAIESEKSALDIDATLGTRLHDVSDSNQLSRSTRRKRSRKNGVQERDSDSHTKFLKVCDETVHHLEYSDTKLPLDDCQKGRSHHSSKRYLHNHHESQPQLDGLRGSKSLFAAQYGICSESDSFENDHVSDSHYTRLHHLAGYPHKQSHLSPRGLTGPENLSRNKYGSECDSHLARLHVGDSPKATFHYRQRHLSSHTPHALPQTRSPSKHDCGNKSGTFVSDPHFTKSHFIDSPLSPKAGTFHRHKHASSHTPPGLPGSINIYKNDYGSESSSFTNDHMSDGRYSRLSVGDSPQPSSYHRHQHVSPHTSLGLWRSENLRKHEYGSDRSSFVKSCMSGSHDTDLHAGAIPERSSKQRHSHVSLRGVAAIEDDHLMHIYGNEGTSFTKGQMRDDGIKYFSNAKQQLSGSEMKQREREHRHHSHESHVYKNQDEQETGNFFEQIRHFVSHSSQNTAASVDEDSAALEESHTKTDAVKTLGKERHKYRHSHHHHKRKQVAADIIRKSKHAKHISGEVSLPVNIHNKVPTKKRHVKHKQHHDETEVQGESVGCKNFNESESFPDSEAVDETESDTFPKARSLSPLGEHRKHHKKHKKKKSSSKVAAASPAQNESLQTKDDAPSEKSCVDDDFIPRKVQRIDDDADETALKSSHNEELPLTEGPGRPVIANRPVTELQKKFLKISGKLPKHWKRATGETTSTTTTSVSPKLADIYKTSIVTEKSAVATVTEEAPQLENESSAENACDTETVTPLVNASGDANIQAQSSHEVTTSETAAAGDSVTVSQQDGGCCDAKGGKTLHAEQEVSGEKSIGSDAEVSEEIQQTVASGVVSDKQAMDIDGSHSVLQSESEKAGMQSLQEDSDSTEKVPYDSANETADGGKFKSSEEDESNAKDLLPESRSFVSHEEAIDKSNNSSVVQTSEVTAKIEEADSAEPHSNNGKAAFPLGDDSKQLDQSYEAEIIPALDSSVKDGASPVVTPNTVEATKVSGTTSISKDRFKVPSVVMPPPSAPAPFKKPLPMKSMRLRITNTSANFISSGAKYSGKNDKDEDAENREEGELSDSDADSDDESLTTSTTDVHQCEGLESLGALDTSGSLTGSDGEISTDEEVGEMLSPTAMAANDQKAFGGESSAKKKKHKRHKKQKGESKKSKTTKKSGGTKLKTKKLKSVKSKISSRTARAFSRSRSRSYSVMRTFDEKRGVWRMRKRQDALARQLAQSRLKACSDLRVHIDKARLREIAVKTAYKRMRSGCGPNVKIRMSELSKVIYGGKSVEELTDLCRQMARTEDSSSDSDSDGVGVGRRWRRPPPSDDECDDAVVLGSRLLQRDANIVLNIRNARQVPVPSKEEKKAHAAVLRLNFPVSSGMQHRTREWEPVKLSAAASVVEPESEREVTRGVNVKNIGQVVTERLNALRQLTVDPNDTAAMNAAYAAQQKLQQWAESKRGPGWLPPTVKLRMPKPLVKSTATPATADMTDENEEVVSASADASISAASEPPASAATSAPAATADTAHTTKSVLHIGRLMLQRMGWKDGEGLGRDSSGPTEPLMIDMKKDRKGLAWVDPELNRWKLPRPLMDTPAMPDLAAMHPVSALAEFCSRSRLMYPAYDLVENSGPAHHKTFRYKVIVDGMEYQPAVASTSKKTARIEAAVICLQELTGVPPPDDAVPLRQMIPPSIPCRPPMPPRAPAPRPIRPRPLMSLQPRPQFASLHLPRALVPTVHLLPTPLAVAGIDFTSNIFDELREFERPTKSQDHSFADDDVCQEIGSDGESCDPEVSKKGLLGDQPEGFEAVEDCEEGADAEYNGEFPDNFPPEFSSDWGGGDELDFSNDYSEDIRQGFGDDQAFHPGFPVSDFTEDICFDNNGPAIFGTHPSNFVEDGTSVFGRLPAFDETAFTPNIHLNNFVGFGRGGMHRLRLPAQHPGLPRWLSPSLQQRFPVLPSQRLHRSGIHLQRPLCNQTRFPQAGLRPQMRPFLRPFPWPR